MTPAAGALLVVLALAVGCGRGEAVEEPSGEGAEARLERQRADVRALTRELTEGAAGALGASVRDAVARWEGCESAFPDTYRSHRYSAQVRLDTDAVGDPLVRLRDVVAAAGLDAEAGEQEPDKLRAGRDGLSASFWRLPAGSRGTLLLTVRGECVEVPEDRRDAWRDRREDRPDPLVD